MSGSFDPFAAAGFGSTADAAPTQQPGDKFDPFAAAGFNAPPAEAPAPAAPPTRAPKILYVDPTTGIPIFENDADNAAMAGGMARGVEKAGEGATFGLLPHAVAAVRSAFGTPYAQGLKEARDYTNKTSEDYPIGAAVAEGVGGLAPGSALAKAIAGPARAGASIIPRIYDSLRTGGILSGANSAGHNIGQGTTDNLAQDTARDVTLGAGLGAGIPILGGLLQAGSNVGRSIYRSAKNMITTPGRDALAGQMLRESNAGFSGPIATSPIPGMPLRTAQATGSPGLSSLENALVSQPANAAADAGEVVQNGVTPNQRAALVRALTGNTQVEPVLLANDTSAAGTAALHGANKALSAGETALWQHPELNRPMLNAPAIASGAAQDAARFPASLRMHVDGPDSSLGVYIREIGDLGPNASINDVNASISRLRAAARDARSGTAPDAAKAKAADDLASAIQARMEARIPGVNPPTATSAVSNGAAHGAQETPWPTPLPAETALPYWGNNTPSARPSPQAVADAYKAARDYTRNYRTTTGEPEFDRVFNVNRQGNAVGNDENVFSNFFDTKGGTTAGVEKLQRLHDLLVSTGNQPQADVLAAAAQNHLKSMIAKAGRSGTASDALGMPNTNPANIAHTVNKAANIINNPMLAPAAQDVQNVGNAASILARSGQTRAGSGSVTFDKFANNKLVDAILGQAQAHALGAAAGGYAGYNHGFDALPRGVNALGGAALGGLAGRYTAPVLNATVNKFASPLVKSTRDDVFQRVMAGLASPEEYLRLIGTEMATGPRIGQSGNVSALTNALTRAAVPQLFRGQGGRP